LSEDFENFSKSNVKEKFGQVGGAGLASLVTDDSFFRISVDWKFLSPGLQKNLTR